MTKLSTKRQPLSRQSSKTIPQENLPSAMEIETQCDTENSYGLTNCRQRLSRKTRNPVYKRIFDTNRGTFEEAAAAPVEASIDPKLNMELEKPKKLKKKSSSMDSTSTECSAFSEPSTFQIAAAVVIAPQVQQYQDSICAYLGQRESSNHSSMDFLQFHCQINERMRNILINWLIGVHKKFELRTQTLFTCVNLIDRYLCRRHIAKDVFQLLGVSCLMIACKYEEIYMPDLRKFVLVCDNAYTAQQILDMESKILLVLEFSLGHSSAMTFVEQRANALDLTSKELVQCQYLLHLCLLDYDLSRSKPSLLSQSAIYLSHMILNLQSLDNLPNKKIKATSLFEQCNITSLEFNSCLTKMFSLYQQRSSQAFEEVYKKFKSQGLE